MANFRWILVALLGPMMIGFSGLATAQERVPAPGRYVIELLVNSDGSVDITCPASQCSSTCRDVEGAAILVQEEFYKIGPGCTVEVTDGLALQEAQEIVLSLLGGPIVPGGGPGGQPPPGLNPNFIVPSQANQNRVVTDVSPQVPASLQ
jgi:hypothetical protein